MWDMIRPRMHKHMRIPAKSVKPSQAKCYRRHRIELCQNQTQRIKQHRRLKLIVDIVGGFNH